MPLVYDELRRVAGRYVRNDPAAQTIQATALVHEAYMRLAGDTRGRWPATRPNERRSCQRPVLIRLFGPR